MKVLNYGCRLVLVLLLQCIAFSQVTQPKQERSAVVPNVKAEDPRQSEFITAKDFWTIALSPLVTLLVSGVGAWYLKRL